jgi:hypothetical protein
MVIRLLRFGLVVVVFMALAVHAVSALGSDAGNLVANASAESGETSPWAGSGWGVEKYGAWSAPAVEYSQQSESVFPLGSYLFDAASPNARIEQHVSLEELASSIESGSQQLSFAAWLGGQASGGSSVATVTFLDGAAHPIGSPVQLGPIAGSELTEQPALLSCETIIDVPVGSRSATVALTGAPGSTGANSYGIADNVFLSTALIGILDSGRYALYPSTTANCEKPGLAPSISEPPTVSRPGLQQGSAAGEGIPTLGLEKIRAGRGSASASLVCSGASESTCSGRLTLTTVVRRRRHRTATIMSVGSVPIRLYAGRQATVAISLNAFGRRLLRARHALHVTLAVLAVDSASDQIVAARRKLMLTS